MITATHWDRETRSGGRWSNPTLLDDVLHLAAIERATVHVIAGWVPKLADLDEKIALGAELEAAMTRAGALRQHALALVERDADQVTGCREWIDPLRTLDAGGG